jgi:hypothetical protein
MLRIFIGYDEIESLAYHVLVQSIIKHTRHPVAITPLKLSMLPMFDRPKAQEQSNEFTYSRFLVPFLSGYQGVSIYMDCDMMLRCDIQGLLMHCDLSKPVCCVKHDYTPKQTTKYLGNKQEAYPRKNWSSLMVFNNAKCRNLTKEYVESAAPADLHRMSWTDEVGGIPLEWNHLVGEYEPNPKARLAHWTNGGPWFSGYENAEFANEWFQLFWDTTNVVDRTALLRG